MTSRRSARTIARAVATAAACAIAVIAAAAPAFGSTSSSGPTPAAASSAPADTAGPTQTPEPEQTPAAPPSDRPGVHVATADHDDLVSRAEDIVAAMSPEQVAGTVVMGNIGSRDPQTVRDYVAAADLGGFLLMGTNVGWEEQTRELTDALVVDAALPPVIAVDQEGGSVERLYWDRGPSAYALRDEPPGSTESAFAARGALVARAGIGVNFGIVADVTDDTGSYIWRRVLGETTSDATARVAAAVIGESPYAASTLKHFPGHGAVTQDSHYTIPETDLSIEQWRSRESRPFAAGIAADASLIMTAHLVYSAVDDAPASLSSAWYDILRDDLGFTGVAVTDDLGMLAQSGEAEYADTPANAVAALRAGADLVLAVAGATPETAGEMATAIRTAVDRGDLPADRLADAATRVVALRLQLAGTGRSALPCEGECAAPAAAD